MVGGVAGRYDVGGHSAAVDLSELHTMAKRGPDRQTKQRIVGEVDNSAFLEWRMIVGKSTVHVGDGLGQGSGGALAACQVRRGFRHLPGWQS